MHAMNMPTVAKLPEIISESEPVIPIDPRSDPESLKRLLYLTKSVEESLKRQKKKNSSFYLNFKISVKCFIDCHDLHVKM